MALGKMSYGDARNCAAKLGTTADDMDAAFNDLKSEMSMLREEFESEGANELYATFDTLAAKLSGFPSKVRNFKGFLNEAVNQYEADDLALQKEVR